MTDQDLTSTIISMVESYKPSRLTTQKLANIELVIVVGPSGVGKSRLIEQSGIPLVPSDTTRSPREDETQGVDMFFRTDYAAIARELEQGKFVQVAVGPAGDFYATRADAYPNSGVAAMPVVSSVVPIFRNLGFKKTITIFVVPPSLEVWMTRLGQQQLTPKQKQKRLIEARKSFEFALHDQATSFVLNDDLQAAANDLKLIVQGKPSVKKQKIAKQTARKVHEGLLKIAEI